MRKILVFTVLWMLLAPPAPADHQDLYRAGLRSFAFGFMREALVFFEAAASEEPSEGASVREYGMWQAPYLPHFYQGEALFALGAYARSLESLAESEAQGAIRRRRNRKYWKRLQELRQKIRRAIEREVGQVHRGAAEDYETLEALQKSRVLAPEIVEAVPEISEIDRILENATASLKNASLLDAASDLQEAISLLDQARDGIATAAREVRKRELEEQEAKQHAERQARLEQARAALDQARDLIDAGGCQPTAIQLLEEVERQGAFEDSEEGELGELDLLSAKAHLLCDHLALAEEYLRRARGRVKADTSRPVSRSLSERRQQQTMGALRHELPEALVEALTDYQLAAALAAQETCQSDEVARLLERAREPLENVDRPSSLPFSYAPHLVLARAHQACAKRGGVEAQLALARVAGRARASELAELDTWLADNPRLEPYTGSYALLVGAYDYNLASGWPALYKPGEDVRQIRQTLEAHGFQVHTLMNPNSQQLASSLSDFFTEYGQERGHRLVFYYAGHGHTERTAHGVKLGYIVPIDAGDPRQDRSHLKRLIGMERFREYARGANANDLLFMFDSCFAGTVFKATRSCVPPDCVAPYGNALTVSERVAQPVRMFLTAGKENQMVPDESLFRRMVSRALAGEADRDRDGFVLGQELGSFVQNMTLFERRAESRVRETSPLLALLDREPAEPQWGTLSEGNFGLGDILFHAPETSSFPMSRVTERRGEIYTQLAYWAAAVESGHLGDVRRYLERFPGGHLAPLARWLLAATMPANGS